ncbi:hypothetical protein EV663_10266 [Rhodovulum bhavnagarense]|uniref:Uncharacterized protein n=1 Tax=Rhodovulum bhavnagarense TaxID=992286 RepID=A0A4R2RF75_9RHOB|nr:hypothetical protein [Rhodovulum bhavnagarense]TCP62222.1 hypothetical protein EV663_10266 [Rhodovulum bhavnagarense]
MRLRNVPMDLLLSNVAVPGFRPAQDPPRDSIRRIQRRLALSVAVLVAANAILGLTESRMAFPGAALAIAAVYALWDDVTYAVFYVARMRGRARFYLSALLAVTVVLALAGVLTATIGALLLLLIQVPLIWTLGFALRDPAQIARTDDSIRHFLRTYKP